MAKQKIMLSNADNNLSSKATLPSRLTTRQAVARALKGKYWLPLTSAVFITSYAYSLGLQEIQVESNLGEPLSAMVYLSVAANERISSSCFSLNKGTSGLPALPDANLRLNRIGNQLALSVTTNTPIKEPVSEVTISSNCSNVPSIQRTYTLMMDPATISEERLANASYGPSNNTRIAQSINSPTRASNRLNNTNTIEQGSRYTVKSGDSLSTIAARISNRPIGSVWNIAAAIHVNNPQAFTNNNPNLIELGSELIIPRISANTNASSTFVKQTMQPSTPQVNNQIPVVAQLNSNADAANTTVVAQYTPAPNEALPIMTLSTQLSALSLERISARASGRVVSDVLLPDTGTLFGTQPDQNQTPQSPSDALSNKQAASNELDNLYVETSSVATVATPDSEKTGGSLFLILMSVFGTLMLLAAAAWKFLIPEVKRRARVDLRKAIRKNRLKKKYISRKAARKEEIERTAAHRTLNANDIEAYAKNQNTDSNELDVLDELDDLNELNTISDDQASQQDTDDNSQEMTLEIADDSNNDFKTKRTHGPRKPKVAQSIYEVGMIDDTGELVSLTRAFPELEAELNARLGDDIPDVGSDLDASATRQTKTMEINADEFAGLKLDPDLFEADESSSETMTVALQSPLGDNLDLELPGLFEETVGEGTDFESIAKDGDFSKTMVFNEEVFDTAESIVDPMDMSLMDETTLSTEMIDADAETRLAPVLRDADGLSPADFGLSDDDFPVDREDYGYLEPDASIVTEALNLTAEELDELGMGDDDNIIPFEPKSKKKSA